MRQTLLPALCALALAAALPDAAFAAGASKGKAGDTGNYYRYRNAQGVLVMEHTIPPEYAGAGYQVLNMSGQVIQDVPPAVVLTEEQRKARQEAEAQSSRRDSELRKLYSAPADAERLRDRQIEALKLKVEQARGQMGQVTARRKAEVEQAARLERSGKPVPPALREGIDRLTRQVAEMELQIKSQESEQARITAEFAPVIERLKVIYPDRAGAKGPAVPAAPTAADKAAAEKAAAAQKLALEKAAAEKAAADRAQVEKLAAEKAAAAKAAAAAQAAAARAAEEKALAERVAAAKAAADKAAAEKAAAAKAAADRQAAEKAAAAKAVADKKAAEKAAAEGIAAAKAAAAELEADKAGKAKVATGKAEKSAAAKAEAEKTRLEEEKRTAGGLRPTGF